MDGERGDGSQPTAKPRCEGGSSWLTYGESEGREQGGEHGEHNVNHDAPFVLRFLFHGVPVFVLKVKLYP